MYDLLKAFGKASASNYALNSSKELPFKLNRLKILKYFNSLKKYNHNINYQQQYDAGPVVF